MSRSPSTPAAWAFWPVITSRARQISGFPSLVSACFTAKATSGSGWIKRVGEIKDPSATRVREGDTAKWILRGNTRDQLVLFSNLGVLYTLKVASVPATTGYGEPVQSVLNFKDRERIVAAVLMPAGTGGEAESSRPRWLVATAGGMGCFCRPDMGETTKSGRRFARVKEGDEFITVSPGDGPLVTGVSQGGKVLSFPARELAELSGPGRGVILMRLDRSDRLAGAACHQTAARLVAVSPDGTERRFHLPEPARRAQKGRKAIKRMSVAELRLEG